MANQSNKVSDNILLLLKKEGALCTSDIADYFQVTTMAVRQHLHIHMQNGLVEYFDQPAERGRPKRMWALSERADQQFPKDVDLFFINLVDFIPEGRRALAFEHIFERYAQQIQQSVNDEDLQRDAASHIQDVLTGCGYLCEVEALEARRLQIKVYHCPHAKLLEVFPALVEREKQLMQQIFRPCKVDIIESNVPYGYHMQYTVHL